MTLQCSVKTPKLILNAPAWVAEIVQLQQAPPDFLLAGLSLRADVSRERPTVQLHGYGMSEG